MYTTLSISFDYLEALARARWRLIFTWAGFSHNAILGAFQLAQQGIILGRHAHAHLCNSDVKLPKLCMRVTIRRGLKSQLEHTY